jgi:hypothetical protein
MKKIYYILTILLCIYVQTANAQMGVNSSGAAPATSSILDVSSTTKGLLIPRMTSAQRDAIVSPANGLMIYNTGINEIQVFNTSWKIASRISIPQVISGSATTGIVQGFNTGTGAGSYGYASGGGEGGKFEATTGTGVSGISTSGYGVSGSSSSTGVYGASTAGTGMEAYANGTSPSASYSGIYARNKATNGFGNGVQGVHDGTGDGVYGIAVSGVGVRAYGVTGVYSDGTTTGVLGSTASGTGVFGRSNTFRGVWGRGITTGDGVYGDAINGRGVYGESSGTGTGVAGYATTSGTGVTGYSNTGYAGFFQSGSNIGLYANSTSNTAIYADNSSLTLPVAQFANISGGTALSVIAPTAIDIAGAIKVSGSASTRAAFKITTNTSGGGNTTANVLTIPNTTLANNINDILIVTHNYSPNSTYLNKNYGVFWNIITLTWNIYLEDISAMPNNVSFNVLVIKQ